MRKRSCKSDSERVSLLEYCKKNNCHVIAVWRIRWPLQCGVLGWELRRGFWIRQLYGNGWHFQRKLAVTCYMGRIVREWRVEMETIESQMLYSGLATTELPIFPNLRNIIGPRNVYFKNISQMILINAHGLLSRYICDDILRQPFSPSPQTQSSDW